MCMCSKINVHFDNHCLYVLNAQSKSHTFLLGWTSKGGHDMYILHMIFFFSVRENKKQKHILLGTYVFSSYSTHTHTHTPYSLVAPIPTHIYPVGTRHIHTLMRQQHWCYVESRKWTVATLVAVFVCVFCLIFLPEGLT